MENEVSQELMGLDHSVIVKIEVVSQLMPHLLQMGVHRGDAATEVLFIDKNKLKDHYIFTLVKV